ncbi:hypothetical protein G7085_13020 [Tessaracoccus sp. HDW20]|uniref:hypothetical protein n=1 Tax=Tessaracoccus coleopterorum TaxID=2714950 RepID=UPI0018D2C945|nr:hypothetical protein [Tessaracoccus coleopterorum]NHB85238.1 hypothetical protein [Tessaracoccus coleopterorum]
MYGIWHSAATFASQGWAVPTVWDEMFELGEKARSLDTFLFVWGDDAAHYYQELAISSAIKEGGDEVRLALDNLEEGAGSCRPCCGCSRPWRPASGRASCCTAGHSSTRRPSGPGTGAPSSIRRVPGSRTRWPAAPPTASR